MRTFDKKNLSDQKLRSLLKKCPKCLVYTLKETCPNCGSPTLSPHPPKFSPDDKYAYLKSNIK